MSQAPRFPSRLQLRIDWSELDLFGHVNNVAYFKYVQASRICYWELLGLSGPGADGMGPMLAATECSFRKPLYYPGGVLIKASLSFMRNTSFGIVHELSNDAGEVAATASDVVVLFDYGRNEKMPIPEALRQKAALLEGRSFDPQ